MVTMVTLYNMVTMVTLYNMVTMVTFTNGDHGDHGDHRALGSLFALPCNNINDREGRSLRVQYVPVHS